MLEATQASGATGTTQATGSTEASTSSTNAQGNQGDSAKPEAKTDADQGDLMFAKKEGEDEKKEGEEKADEKEGEKAEAVYDFKLPDDAQPVPEMLDNLKVFAKENKLSPEAAQKIVDMGVEMQTKQLEQWNSTKKAWRDEVRADSVLGGHNLDASIKTAEDIVARFGGNETEIKEMQDDLVFMGLGNKKSFIRFCNNIAKATKEDSMDGSVNKSAERQAEGLAQRMWPNMPGDKK